MALNLNHVALGHGLVVEEKNDKYIPPPLPDRKKIKSEQENYLSY